MGFMLVVFYSVLLSRRKYIVGKMYHETRLLCCKLSTRVEAKSALSRKQGLNLAQQSSLSEG